MGSDLDEALSRICTTEWARHSPEEWRAYLFQIGPAKAGCEALPPVGNLNLFNAAFRIYRPDLFYRGGGPRAKKLSPLRFLGLSPSHELCGHLFGHFDLSCEARSYGHDLFYETSVLEGLALRAFSDMKNVWPDCEVGSFQSFPTLVRGCNPDGIDRSKGWKGFTEEEAPCFDPETVESIQQGVLDDYRVYGSMLDAEVVDVAEVARFTDWLLGETCTRFLRDIEDGWRVAADYHARFWEPCGRTPSVWAAECGRFVRYDLDAEIGGFPRRGKRGTEGRPPLLLLELRMAGTPEEEERARHAEDEPCLMRWRFIPANTPFAYKSGEDTTHLRSVSEFDPDNRAAPIQGGAHEKA